MFSQLAVREYSHLTHSFTPGVYEDPSLHFLSPEECLERIAFENNHYTLYEVANSSVGVVQTADIFQRLIRWVMKHIVDDSQCEIYCGISL